MKTTDILSPLYINENLSQHCINRPFQKYHVYLTQKLLKRRRVHNGQTH